MQGIEALESEEGAFLNSFGDPFDVKHLECYFWATQGTCKWGSKCRYAHESTGRVAKMPQPAGNGRSVAGKNALSERPIFRKWQGLDLYDARRDDTKADLHEYHHQLDQHHVGIALERRSRSLARLQYPDLERGRAGARRFDSRSASPRPAQLLAAGNNSHSQSPTKASSQTGYLSEIRYLIPNTSGVSSNELQNAVSVDSRSPRNMEPLSYVKSGRNVSMVYKPLPDCPYPQTTAPSHSTTTTIAIPFEEYKDFQNQKKLLAKTISDQRKLLRQVTHLLESGYHVLESEGQLAMDLSQRMQRGETIDPDTVTEAWLSANHLLEEAAAFRIMFRDWSHTISKQEQDRRLVKEEED